MFNSKAFNIESKKFEKRWLEPGQLLSEPAGSGMNRNPKCLLVETATPCVDERATADEPIAICCEPSFERH